MLTLFRIAFEDESLEIGGEGILIPPSMTTMCRLATGRSALFHLIQRLPRPNAATVLLPSYVAEGVIQPFLTAGFTILFYRLQPDLRPMVEDLRTLLDQVHGVAVVVLIHYFGFPAHSAELSSVLFRYHPVVVDDCAHALFTTTPDRRPLADNADLTLYSLNKFLPVVDGAIIISSRSDIDLSLDEKMLAELPDETQQAYQRHLQAGRELFNSNGSSQAKSILEKLGECYEQYYAVINTELSPFCQSAHSRHIEDNFPFDSLIKKRLINSSILYKELKNPVFSLVHKKLHSGVVPWCVTARVPVEQREEIINDLFDQGILLSTLKDKWDFIPANMDSHFNFESAFIEDHVLIPVSEFISEDSMRFMVEQLNHVKRF